MSNENKKRLEAHVSGIMSMTASFVEEYAEKNKERLFTMNGYDALECIIAEFNLIGRKLKISEGDDGG